MQRQGPLRYCGYLPYRRLRRPRGMPSVSGWSSSGWGARFGARMWTWGIWDSSPIKRARHRDRPRFAQRRAGLALGLHFGGALLAQREVVRRPQICTSSAVHRPHTRRWPRWTGARWNRTDGARPTGLRQRNEFRRQPGQCAAERLARIHHYQRPLPRRSRIRTPLNAARSLTMNLARRGRDRHATTDRRTAVEADSAPVPPRGAAR